MNEQAGAQQRVSDACLIADEGDDRVALATEFAQANGIGLTRCEPAQLGESRTRPTARHWIVAVDDSRMTGVIGAAVAAGACLGFLPAQGSVITRLFCLPRETQAQLELAFSGDSVEIDVTRCNDEPVLAIVAIGDVPFMDHHGRALLRGQSSWLRRARLSLNLFWRTAKRLFAIHPTAVSLTIGDDETKRQSAITGLVVLDHDADKLSNSLLGERMSARDGRLSALLVAPTSIMAYLAVLFRGLRGTGKVPRAASFIKSRKLVVESASPLQYRIDGQRRESKRIRFEVDANALSIKPGEVFLEEHPVDPDSRDSLRLRTLPENELRLSSIKGGLPLFTHALEEDFKDLFAQLRDSSRVSPDYLIMMVASALLAALGLILGSAAVIIGAMVLAPLMAPIVGLSMGLLRRDESLVRSAVRTIGIGVALAVLMPALLAAIVPFRDANSEILARVNPSLLDLAVAVVSGVAAAYAHAREHISKSMPGVAIAVALVPPLAVAGIGIGWGDAAMFGGAMLLFLTNLVGIAASAAVMFLLLGYAPISTAARGLRSLAIATVLMSIPLYLSFSQIVSVARIESELSSEAVEIDGERYRLREPQVALEGDLVTVRAVLSSRGEVSRETVNAIRGQLSDRLNRPLRLELDVRLVSD